MEDKKHYRTMASGINFIHNYWYQQFELVILLIRIADITISN